MAKLKDRLGYFSTIFKRSDDLEQYVSKASGKANAGAIAPEDRHKQRMETPVYATEQYEKFIEESAKGNTAIVPSPNIISRVEKVQNGDKRGENNWFVETVDNNTPTGVNYITIEGDASTFTNLQLGPIAGTIQCSNDASSWTTMSSPSPTLLYLDGVAQCFYRAAYYDKMNGDVRMYAYRYDADTICYFNTLNIVVGSTNAWYFVNDQWMETTVTPYYIEYVSHVVLDSHGDGEYVGYRQIDGDEYKEETIRMYCFNAYGAYYYVDTLDITTSTKVWNFTDEGWVESTYTVIAPAHCYEYNVVNGKVFLRGKTFNVGGLYDVFNGETGYTKISGPLISLVDYKNMSTAVMAYGHFVEHSGWYGVFSTSNVEDVSELIFPTILSTDCFAYMFQNCTSLTSVPVLPATTLADYCYESMFSGCNALASVPTDMLPATTLANSCYSCMFYQCTSLSVAPSLPATTLAESCYSSMFNMEDTESGNHVLTTAPSLPATTLVAQCYECMFYQCHALNNVTCLATDISAACCTNNWLNNVSSTGTFHRAETMTSWTTGTSGIPEGWEVDPQMPIILTFSAGEHGGLTATVNGTTVTSPAQVAEGDAIVLTASPASGYVLDSWSGLPASATISGNVVSFSMPANDVTASVTFDVTRDWLTFTAKVTNPTVKFMQVGSSGTWPIEYNTGSGWQSYTLGTTLTLANIGDSVKFRGTKDSTAQSSTNYRYFVTSGNGDALSITGDVTTLLNKVGNALDLTPYGDYTLCKLFYSMSNFTSAPVLPSTTLTAGCYYQMFMSCTRLTNAPSLPAQTLTYRCYFGMFQACTQLVNPPTISATSLAESCYQQMFYNCQALTSTPSLSISTLAKNCYNQMFYQCYVLETVPASLPAMTLTEGCYHQMFQSCKALKTAPALPATTLAPLCYYGMFTACIALTTPPPSLPATTLAEVSGGKGCYACMFSGCSTLASVPTDYLPATTLTQNCYQYMFQSCKALTQAPNLPASTLTVFCYSYMFQYCQALVTPPTISATTLDSNCCENMFDNCNYLSCAPDLLATTLKSYCYNKMFYNCSRLATPVRIYATTTPSTSYTSQMFTSSGSARGGQSTISVAANVSSWNTTNAGINSTYWTVEQITEETE